MNLISLIWTLRFIIIFDKFYGLRLFLWRFESPSPVFEMAHSLAHQLLKILALARTTALGLPNPFLLQQRNPPTKGRQKDLKSTPPLTQLLTPVPRPRERVTWT